MSVKSFLIYLGKNKNKITEDDYNHLYDLFIEENRSLGDFYDICEYLKSFDPVLKNKNPKSKIVLLAKYDELELYSADKHNEMRVRMYLPNGYQTLQPDLAKIHDMLSSLPNSKKLLKRRIIIDRYANLGHHNNRKAPAAYVKPFIPEFKQNKVIKGKDIIINREGTLKNLSLIIHEFGHAYLEEILPDDLARNFAIAHDKVSRFSNNHNPFHFVSPYASKNMEEDFAETFSALITKDESYRKSPEAFERLLNALDT